MAVASCLRFPAVDWKMDGQCDVMSSRVTRSVDCAVTPSCSCLLSVLVGLVRWRPCLGRYDVPVRAPDRGNELCNWVQVGRGVASYR